METPKFVTGMPALAAAGRLVISDLHLGLEYDYRKGGIKFPSQTGKLQAMIFEALEKSGCRKITVIGDIKHKVPGTSFQEIKEIPEFFTKLLEMADIEIVPGNHDSGIAGMLPENVKVYPSGGFVSRGFYFGHGHTWPPEKAFSTRFMIIGHRHPAVEFRDSLGYRFTERVWVKGILERKTLERRYKNLPERLPQVLVVPVFNPMVGGAAFNAGISGNDRDKIGPLLNAVDEEASELFLLDGTYMGTIAQIKNAKLN